MPFNWSKAVEENRLVFNDNEGFRIPIKLQRFIADIALQEQESNVIKPATLEPNGVWNILTDLPEAVLFSPATTFLIRPPAPNVSGQSLSINSQSTRQIIAGEGESLQADVLKQDYLYRIKYNDDNSLWQLISKPSQFIATRNELVRRFNDFLTPANLPLFVNRGNLDEPNLQDNIDTRFDGAIQTGYYRAHALNTSLLDTETPYTPPDLPQGHFELANPDSDLLVFFTKGREKIIQILITSSIFTRYGTEFDGRYIWSKWRY